MDKKGQAAMEFLITYGWAILAAIVAIGVLAYFLSSPGRFTSNSCVVASPWNCNAGNVDQAANNVQLELRNGGGEVFNVQSVVISACNTTAYASPGLNVPADNLTTITVGPCSPALTTGTTFRGDITVTYRKSGSLLDQTSTGRIVQRL